MSKNKLGNLSEHKKIILLLMGIFLIGLVNASWSASLDNGLVAYYTNDYPSGNLIDSLGNYNLTKQSNPVYNQTGVVNKAIKMGQYSGYFSGSIDKTSEDTNSIVIWFNRSEAGTGVILFGNSNSPASKAGMRVSYDNTNVYCQVNDAGYGPVAVSPLPPDTDFHQVVCIYNGTTIHQYIDGEFTANSTWDGRSLKEAGNTVVIGSDISGFISSGNSSLDEISIYNRTLTTSEIIELYNLGSGCSYGICNEINVSLDSPTNNSVILLTEQFFNVSLNITGKNKSYSWDNITYNVWFENGTLYNSTLREGLTGNSTSVSLEIGGFFLGSYIWNVDACYSNATYSSCNSSNLGNYTFSRGSTVNSFVYNNHTYETKREAFFANITLLPGAELSLAQLIYNGTTYTISNITSSGDNYLFYKEIDIPLNVNGSINQTNVFYIRFNYGGTSTQTFGPYYQNSSFINLVRCNTDYTIQALNLTFYDEYNQKIIDSTNNKTSLEASFNYWIGSGEVYKNYSFQNLTSTQGSYTFCIYPFEAENFTFKADMDSEYSALTYSEGKYYLRNSTLTNISSDIFLYLIPSDYSTKFYLTFKKGVDLISDATVTVQKFFIGLGEYKTVSILQTDVDGKSSMYQDLDATYRYSIVKDGVLLGTIEKVSICATAPCSMTIYLSEALDTAFSAYDDYYAINILSNLSFNRSSSIVTYTFIDTTGLANYFRLDVKQSKLNVGSVLICNSTSYSSAGTLTCNLTGYEGDFIATGYISRSPEKVDRVLGFIIDADILEELGLNGVFIVIILLITLVIAAAIISKGNPSTVLFVLGISILGLKLIGIFPFSWVIVVTLEVLIIYMISKIKT